MATLIVRDVPYALYSRLQELAAEKDLPMSAFVIAIMEETAQRVTRKTEVLAAMERIEQRRSQFPPLEDGEVSLSLLREDRER